MNAVKSCSEFQGYSEQTRINFHKLDASSASQPTKIKFSCQHKSYPGLEVIMSLSIGAVESSFLPKSDLKQNNLTICENHSSILTIESLKIVDSWNDLSAVSDEVLQSLLSSVLMASFEYSSSHKIKEWLIPVKPEFDKELSDIGLPHQRYSFDKNGRCIIGVFPSEFLSKGKQLIDSWTRRMFECKSAYC